MENKQLTQKQIKELWKGCGVVELIRPTTDEDYHTYRFPDGQLSGFYPLLDLNNLFAYAVPIAIKVLVEQSRTIAPPLCISESTAFRELMQRWFSQCPMQFGLETSLSWVIWEVIHSLSWVIWEVIHGE